MSAKLACCLMFVLLQVANIHNEPMGLTAMTTVLARPLGGYGLTPLVFEPSSQFLGSSSNSVETKVPKGPTYELLMPNFDDEALPSIPVTSTITGSKLLPKKLDYESLLSKMGNDKHISEPSTNTYYSSGNVMDLFKEKDSRLFDEPLPSYKDQGTKSLYSQQSPKPVIYQQPTYSQTQGSYNAAIQSIRSVEVKDIQDSYQNNEPQIIDIAPSALPIVINFRTSSSQIQIHQTHESSEPTEVKQTKSEDEPQYLKHQVTKPVIQEVHEIIMPYRRIIQEIRPVEEEIKTVVARGTRKDRSGRDKNGSSSKYNSGSTNKASYGLSPKLSTVQDSKYKS